MPADLLLDKDSSTDGVRFGGLGSRTMNESECKIYLIVTLSVALTFCVLSAAVVLVACVKRYQVSHPGSLVESNPGLCMFWVQDFTFLPNLILLSLFYPMQYFSTYFAIDLFYPICSV